MPSADVMFSQQAGIRFCQLNRPALLNSFNECMIAAMIQGFKVAECDPQVQAIFILSTGSRSFSTGGDIREVLRWNKTGPEGERRVEDHFSKIYKLFYLIATYRKPCITLLDGLVIGGGAGIGTNAAVRVATENTTFILPETSFGFTPGGCTYLLSRLKGYIGHFLALTGLPLKGSDVYYAGIATHYLPSSRLPELADRLAVQRLWEFSTLEHRLEVIDQTINEIAEDTNSEGSVLAFQDLREMTNKCFCHASMQEIVQALQKESSAPAQAALEALSTCSPTALVSTHRLMHHAATYTLEESFQQEWTVAAKMMSLHDFAEGIHCRLLHKPPLTPVWLPGSICHVEEENVTISGPCLPEPQLRLALQKTTRMDPHVAIEAGPQDYQNTDRSPNTVSSPGRKVKNSILHFLERRSRPQSRGPPTTSNLTAARHKL